VADPRLLNLTSTDELSDGMYTVWWRYVDGYTSALAFHDTVAGANGSSFMAAVGASSVAFAATCVEPFNGSTAASGADVVVGTRDSHSFLAVCS
jgi:hypothetical protein